MTDRHEEEFLDLMGFGRSVTSACDDENIVEAATHFRKANGELDAWYATRDIARERGQERSVRGLDPELSRLLYERNAAAGYLGTLQPESMRGVEALLEVAIGIETEFRTNRDGILGDGPVLEMLIHAKTAIEPLMEAYLNDVLREVGSGGAS